MSDSKGSPRSHRDAVRRGLVYGLYHVALNHKITINAAGAAVGFGSLLIDDIPKGIWDLRYSSCALKFTKLDANLIATWSGTYGFGTTATADLTLATTEIGIIGSAGAGVAIGPAVAGVFSAARATQAPTQSPPYDNSSGSLAIFLNMTANAADITDSSAAVVLVQGFLELVGGFLVLP